MFMLARCLEGHGGASARTLLDAILLGAVLDALDALLEVVLGRGALLRIPALWESVMSARRFSTYGQFVCAEIWWASLRSSGVDGIRQTPRRASLRMGIASSLALHVTRARRVCIRRGRVVRWASRTFLESLLGVLQLLLLFLLFLLLGLVLCLLLLSLG